MHPSDSYVPSSERVSVDHFLGSAPEYLIYLTHVAAYDFAGPYATGRRVLDFGCGTGFGAHRLATACSDVVGVDVSDEAIRFARERYRAPGLSFQAIRSVPTEPLPFADGSFGLVVSFQVIEHVSAVDAYLEEVSRVLAPGGVFLCSTPDRRNRLFRWQRPWNVHHVVEYGPSELAVVLARHFGRVELLGVTATAGTIGQELRRRARARWLTLPVTFPGAPEWWRQRGLRVLKGLAGTGPCDHEEGPPRTPEEARTVYGFDGSAVTIVEVAKPALDLIAVVRR